MHVSIEALMASSNVGFGTSGARGLVTDMTDLVCYAYTLGFLQYLKTTATASAAPPEVAVAGDLRPSTDRIMAAVCRAAADAGQRPVNCGRIPSPAVALYGIERQIPAVMVTGSHIPDDRNGIKFNRREGEILKADEAGIRAQTVAVDASLFDDAQRFRREQKLPAVDLEADRRYRRRYLAFFPEGCLAGKRIGVYQHSAVGRDLLLDILAQLGADVVALGRSDAFVPVDTEAIRPEDVRLASRWAAEGGFDAVVSTDGDSDRPLIADENGRWLRGDVAGILCARYLGAKSVSTPVSCNTAVEKCGWFEETRRTRIGSPYVVAAMMAASAEGAGPVVGYEANGGFLTDSVVDLEGRQLPALPTRDAVIVILSLMHLSARQHRSLSQLVAALPPRFTASDRLKAFPREQSQAVLDHFTTGDPESDLERAAAVFGDLCGKPLTIDRTDGVRMVFANQEVVHLRPSGNAPEFRCYNEAADDQRVRELNRACMARLDQLKGDGRVPG
jgi:phosphomannomutase